MGAASDEAADTEASAQVAVDEVGWDGAVLEDTAEAEVDGPVTEFEIVAAPLFVVAVAG